MPVIYQKMIYREDLRRNRECLYLFGDNAKRHGLGGQAAEMRGEPNAIGVRTKWAAFKGPGAYFSDDTYDANIQMIWEDMGPAFDHVRDGGIVVIPADGLGTGLAEMSTRAPVTLECLNSLIRQLENTPVSIKS